ncbi:MAG TPA: hypothetical protein PLH94_10665 [Fimbriimonadaceae bacterium]|nr:hypothetical protein [Fimbriimonadaceae bacterium]
MMFRFAILVALFALIVPTWGQVTSDERSKAADEILRKVRRLDLMNQILPLVLTKSQYAKVLPTIEKARAAVKKQEQIEYDFLSKLSPKIDKALKEAVDNGKVPGNEVINETWATFQTLGIMRKAVADDNVDKVFEVFKATLNAGQIKTAANSVNVKAFDPNADPKTMGDDAKLRIYIRLIVLDPLAYDLLLQLSRKAE